jgi:hypothetical protein
MPLPELIASGDVFTCRGCWGIKVNVDYIGVFLALDPNLAKMGKVNTATSVR